MDTKKEERQKLGRKRKCVNDFYFYLSMLQNNITHQILDGRYGPRENNDNWCLNEALRKRYVTTNEMGLSFLVGVKRFSFMCLAWCGSNDRNLVWRALLGLEVLNNWYKSGLKKMGSTWARMSLMCVCVCVSERMGNQH